MYRFTKTVCALAAMSCTACANLNSINHSFRPDNGDALTIDAKQRAIYTVTKGDGSKTWKAVCAEPSPDALAALSVGASLDASATGKALGLALSSQEGAASIGLRTQSITIMRDAMYRLCEGYASGALDEISFARLHRRHQNSILGLLAIEQLTGAVVANQASIGGSAAAKLGQSLADVNEAVSAAQTMASEAAAALSSAKAKAVVTAKEKLDAQAAFDKEKRAAKGDESAEAVVAAKAELTAKAAADDQAQKLRSQAVIADGAAGGELLSLQNLRKEVQRASANAEQLVGFKKIGGNGGPTDSAAYVAVAKAVTNIVDKLAEHDYTAESCMDNVMSRRSRGNTLADMDLLDLQVAYCSDHLVALQSERLARGGLSVTALSKAPELLGERPLYSRQDAVLKRMRDDLNKKK